MRQAACQYIFKSRLSYLASSTKAFGVPERINPLVLDGRHLVDPVRQLQQQQPVAVIRLLPYAGLVGIDYRDHLHHQRPVEGPHIAAVGEVLWIHRAAKLPQVVLYQASSIREVTVLPAEEAKSWRAYR